MFSTLKKFYDSWNGISYIPEWIKAVPYPAVQFDLTQV